MIKFMNSKPALIYLSWLSFGLSLCSTLQLSNLSTIFSFLGASTSSLPWLWLAPPITGLIVQPLIGQISDDTISRYGKRRPYIFAWGVLGALTFILLPFFNSLFLAVCFTWLIDCCLNGGTEALRALTGDVLTKEDERGKAFALQACFAGIGGALATGLPYYTHKLLVYFHSETTRIQHALPNNLKISFILTGLCLLIVVCIAFYKIKEKPYKHSGLLQKKKVHTPLRKRIIKIFNDLYISFKRSPVYFRQICLTHSLSWGGIFIFWLFFTSAIAQNIYGMQAEANLAVNPDQAQLLQKAALDASLYNAIYQYVSIAYAAVLFFISTNKNKNVFLHAFSLLVGGAGIALISIEHAPWAIELSMVAYGIMWGSLLVLPYAIAVQALPKGKLGIYLGIFNMCITAPQIFCGLFLSPIYTYIFQGKASLLLLLSGFLIIASAGFWFKIGSARFNVFVSFKEAFSVKS